MAHLHEGYKCRCHVHTPMFVNTQTHAVGSNMGVGYEESGICFACRKIYDERLYEMRLRQHNSSLPEGDLDTILSEIDPNYQKLVGVTR